MAKARQQGSTDWEPKPPSTRKRNEATDITEDAITVGLRRFYSSQAEVMLAQYENINSLLGPTSHHTHRGTHCEVLLRNCIRTFLPPNWSANKGFIFGRVCRNGKHVHSPEIDILIHDISVARPVFQLDDFVIVPPESGRWRHSSQKVASKWSADTSD